MLVPQPRSHPWCVGTSSLVPSLVCWYLIPGPIPGVLVPHPWSHPWCVGTSTPVPSLVCWYLIPGPIPGVLVPHPWSHPWCVGTSSLVPSLVCWYLIPGPIPGVLVPHPWSHPCCLQEDKIAGLQSHANQLIQKQHYAAVQIADRRASVLSRWSKLKDALVDLKKKLGESKSVQQFLRDADDTEAWISEKLQMAGDESYLDPTDLQVREDRTHQV